MKVHHLNCGTFDSPLAGTIVCHALACETDNGIVLVDTGFGLADLADRSRRLGPLPRLMGAKFFESETAVRRLEGLGFATSDVTHIVATHLDFDHIGGAGDFPNATIHTTAVEDAAARARASASDKVRYRPAQQPPDSEMRTYSGPGEPLLGFPDAHRLDTIGDGFFLLPLPGHTKGHAAVAVDTGNGWLVHAGDAFYHHSVVAPPGVDSPGFQGRFMRVVEKVLADDRSRISENHRRLRELNTQQSSHVTVFCAHDRKQLEELQQRG
ncbi:MBL fold metallo-hydrolase [Rhodococcus sp. NPDC058521]|uniref:MBL fold metallo-hydrolase n=1 Tax=Rhodococcus sp. NPDC058521 TaxID=3346536 RepID=UPI003649F50B